MVAIVHTQKANTDLLEAWLYIAEESLAAADRVLDTIDKELRMLATQPKMGRQRPELGKDVHSWPTSTPYILFYVLKGNELTVLRVLHHSRDIQHVMGQ